jgi:hypothetical protein
MRPTVPRTRVGERVRITSIERPGQRGFTYLILIIAIAILGVALAGIGALASASSRHQRMVELKWIGEQYRVAVGSYYESSPGSVKVFPKKLEELLIDSRYLTIRRHIRELYVDPLTGLADWREVHAPDGGIQGIEVDVVEGQPSQLQYLYVPLAISPTK